MILSRQQIVIKKGYIMPTLQNQVKNIPTGSIRTFGQHGTTYIVGTPAELLEDGDWLVNIELPESGEQATYRLSKIIADPKVN